MTIKMPELVPKELDKVCIHALTVMQTLLQTIVRGYSARNLGIGQKIMKGTCNA